MREQTTEGQMSSEAKNIIPKELIYVAEQAIMNNMENTAETINKLLELVQLLEARLTELDNL